MNLLKAVAIWLFIGLFFGASWYEGVALRSAGECLFVNLALVGIALKLDAWVREKPSDVRFTILGGNDPAAQRQIAEMVRKAVRRGL